MQPCRDCQHYVNFHGHGAHLACAMHPYGPEGESCEDFEQSPFVVKLSPEAVEELNNSLAAQAEAVNQAALQVGEALLAAMPAIERAAQKIADAFKL